MPSGIRTRTSGIMIPAFVLPVTYTGPGDVVSGSIAWWGLRAYSQAKIGTNAIRLRASGDSAESDFVTVSGGGLDLTGISNFQTTHGGNLFVVKIYDQTGTGNDVQQTAAGAQPPFSFNALGSFPAIQPTSAGAFLGNLCSLTNGPAQPVHAVQVTNYANSGSQGVSWFMTRPPSIGGHNDQGGAANLVGGFTSANFSATASDNSHHAVQILYNSASSEVYVDGSATTGLDCGSSAGLATTTDLSLLAQNTGGQSWFGKFHELGIWPGTFTSGNKSSLNSNQHNYWGF